MQDIIFYKQQLEEYKNRLKTLKKDTLEYWDCQNQVKACKKYIKKLESK